LANLVKLYVSDSGRLLLQLCYNRALCITNTFSQLCD